MKKAIAKPVNWQDFESLCKKLWGEIWNCPNIKKNGRSGQPQHGVDVYGIPQGHKKYSGIQCKGKDDYANTTLTKQEVDQEIRKALDFTPSLESFLFATTANKDVEIEQYVRERNVESIANGKFEIEIFLWEDIADLIEENRETYNWYVKNLMHKNTYSVSILINNEIGNAVLNPEYVRRITKIKKKVVLPVNSMTRAMQSIAAANVHFLEPILLHDKYELDLSRAAATIAFVNTGNAPLDHFKLILDFEGNDFEIFESNSIRSSLFDSMSVVHRNYWIDGKRIIYNHSPSYPVLVPKDGREFSVYVKSDSVSNKILVRYRFLSSEFNVDGAIEISFLPIYEDEIITVEPEFEGQEENEKEEILPRIVQER